MHEPLTDAELDEILSEYDIATDPEYAGTIAAMKSNDRVLGNVPELVAEIRRLRAIDSSRLRLFRDLQEVRADLAAARDAHAAYVATSDAGRLAAEVERLREELAKYASPFGNTD